MLMHVSTVPHNQKCHVALHFDNLDLRSAKVPLIMLFYNIMQMPVPMILYDQQSHAAPHFYHFDLRK